MRVATTVVSIVTTLIVGAAAFAASAAKNPTSLILHKADFPSGVEYDMSSDDGLGIEDTLAARGVETEAASYLGATYSKTKGFLQVSGAVYATASVATARRVFAGVKKERDTFWRLSGEARPMTAPSYGNEQFARYDPPGGEGIGIMELIVRRNTVVWLLNVKLERRTAPPKAALLGDLKKYALKQKSRVGRG